MKIGAMNNPQRDICEEIRWMVDLRLDFIDLTLEPPRAASWLIDVPRVRRALEDSALEIVGHTAFYLPIANPFDEIRRAAVDELRRCLEVFSLLGVRWMNLHADRHAPLHNRAFLVERNLASLREISEIAQRAGIGLMLENVPGDFNTAADLGDLLEPLPEMALHLDIGHANLQVTCNTTEEILGAYSSRLRHVHLHDNKGGMADLHLPLGVGTMDMARQLRLLKNIGYDGTITLEVFSPDRHYLGYSRDVLRRLWDSL